MMNEAVKLPGYDKIVDCLYRQFLDEAGQEFDYDSYNSVLERIQLLTDGQDYVELEDAITEGFENSSKNGFVMGVGIAMQFLFGWQQAFQAEKKEEASHDYE